METTKIFLKEILAQSGSKDALYRRNLLKEYLQILVLDFIYSQTKYSSLVFYGGSCLSHCFALPRLSEDLDFVDLKKKINLSCLSKDLSNYFQKNTGLVLKTSLQKSRITLKFSLLYELGLTKKPESDLLFFKIEIFKEFNYCKSYKIETIPLFKFNKSILIRTFDLPTLMATKIRAIFYRKWVKTDKKGKALIKVKGRDYFDLMWYLKKGITPNLNCLEEVAGKGELKERLLGIIEGLDSKSVQLDLESLIEDKHFVRNLSQNFKEILKREIRANL